VSFRSSNQDWTGTLGDGGGGEHQQLRFCSHSGSYIMEEDPRCIQQNPEKQLVVKRTHGIFWVENVRGGRIVDDDDVAELSSQPTEVFDVVPSVEDAGFSKESLSEDAPLVQQVGHGVRVLSTPSTHTTRYKRGQVEVTAATAARLELHLNKGKPVAFARRQHYDYRKHD